MLPEDYRDRMGDESTDQWMEVRDDSGAVYRVPRGLIRQFVVLSEEERATRRHTERDVLATMLAQHSPEDRAAAERRVGKLIARSKGQ